MARRAALIGFAVSALAIGAVAQTAVAADGANAPAKSAKAWVPKKTPWGDPDLQGTWPLDQLGRTPLQRPAQYGDQLYLTDAQYKKALADAAAANQGAEKEEKSNKLGAGHWFEYGEPLLIIE